jgi:DNA-directed RNA polymerase subunit N (RpoN/RPB10)
MIIPVKCFTCGEVLADKYRCYMAEVAIRKQHTGASSQTEYLTKTMDQKSIEGFVLDDLGLVKPCCRRHMLTHIDVL